METVHEKCNSIVCGLRTVINNVGMWTVYEIC